MRTISTSIRIAAASPIDVVVDAQPEEDDLGEEAGVPQLMETLDEALDFLRAGLSAFMARETSASPPERSAGVDRARS